MSATNNAIPANHNQEILLVGGPKDGQWIPPLGESTGQRIFFPFIDEAMSAELAFATSGPLPYQHPPRYGHVAYDRVKLQLLTSYGRSEIVEILHREGDSSQSFDATEFLHKLLESYGEPKARWRKPTPEDGGWGRYYFVKDGVDEYTIERWHEPIQIHPFSGGQWMTHRPGFKTVQHFFSKNLEVCECVRPIK